MIMFPELLPPAYQDGRQYDGGIQVISQTNVQVAGPPIKDVAERYGARKVRYVATFRGHSLVRLIAKVAYGAMVADFGIDNWEEVYVLPAIMGRSDDGGRWVGCDGKRKLTSRPLPLHGIAREVINGEVTARLSLFAQFGAPEYVVVVGKLQPNARPGRFPMPGKVR